MSEETGVEATKSSYVFGVNEEVNLKTNEKYFSISGTHIVEYNWFRAGHFKTREEAEKEIETPSSKRG